MVYYLLYFLFLCVLEFYIEILLLVLCVRVFGYLKWLFSMVGIGGFFSVSNVILSGFDCKMSV